MSCSNCFNGCAEIVSDKCVKYTGIDIPKLGIENGDPLIVVENKITEKLLTLMDGSGIIPIVDPVIICTIVRSFLPVSEPFTLNHLITAIIRSICVINGKAEAAQLQLDALNANYTLPLNCLAGVVPSSDTHQIVQAVIIKVCGLAADVEALTLQLTQYVPINQLNNLIQQYLDTITSVASYKNRMVPWVAYPLFEATGLTHFDAFGVGTGSWEGIYLCNGVSKPGIPDLRGRAIVGVTSGPGGTMDNAVNPGVPPGSPVGSSPNPTYSTPGTRFGANQVPLTINQIPSHNHSAQVTIVDPLHNHTFTTATLPVTGGTGPFIVTGNVSSGLTQPINNSSTNLRGDELPGPKNVTVNIGNRGADPVEHHSNIQPVSPAYWIMYIP